MLTFKDKVKKASSYKNTDFFQAENIGVIARGPSVRALNLCYNNFNHCFLAGEFNNSLDKIGKYLTNKDIVLCIVQEGRYRTYIENCKKYNIQNIQVRFLEGTENFKRCVREFSDLKVTGCNQEHSEIAGRIDKEHKIFSTGITGIFYALYFNPKNIYIIGIDFYNKNADKYFIKEIHDSDASLETSRRRWKNDMIRNLKKMVFLYPETNFYLYTTYRGIESSNNLNVIYV